MTDDRQLKENITKVWDTAFSDYDDCYAHGIKSAGEKAAWLTFLHSVFGPEALDVLDVGAGTGIISLLLAELGHRVKGIDLSKNMLSVAERKARIGGFDSVRFAIGDAEDTGEAAESYDVVTNRHLVWTLPHPEKAIAEWRRALKPGGRLIIMEGNWNFPSFGDRAQIFAGKCLLSLQERQNAFTHRGDYDAETKKALPMLRRENAEALASMVEAAGFRVQVLPLTDVDRAEKDAMPLARRLMNPYRRIAVIGTKV